MTHQPNRQMQELMDTSFKVMEEHLSNFLRAILEPNSLILLGVLPLQPNRILLRHKTQTIS